MKKLTIILIALLIGSGVMAQSAQPCSSCLPEGIIFYAQAQIDSFQINYPGCTEIQGKVIIDAHRITNLNGLSALTSISGFLQIGPVAFGDPSFLPSLTGLGNLTSIGGDLRISSNDSLTSLTGLDNLNSIGGQLYISGNDSLTSLTGLDNLTSIGGYLSIESNAALTSLTGLDNLTSIGGGLSIGGNAALTSLTGLDNLTYIVGGLSIGGNDVLTSLTGLDNLISIGGPLLIGYNYVLTSLSGLNNINGGSISHLFIYFNHLLSTCGVKSICDYLVSPNGEVEIHDNATGCNSQEEVHLACTFGLDESNTFDDQFNIYPNPSSTIITIETPTAPYKNTIITIYNINGQALISRQITEPIINVDVSGLTQGIYFVKIKGDRTVQVGRFVKQ